MVLQTAAWLSLLLCAGDARAALPTASPRAVAAWRGFSVSPVGATFAARLALDFSSPRSAAAFVSVMSRPLPGALPSAPTLAQLEALAAARPEALESAVRARLDASLAALESLPQAPLVASADDAVLLSALAPALSGDGPARAERLAHTAVMAKASVDGAAVAATVEERLAELVAHFTSRAAGPDGAAPSAAVDAPQDRRRRLPASWTLRPSPRVATRANEEPLSRELYASLQRGIREAKAQARVTTGKLTNQLGANRFVTHRGSRHFADLVRDPAVSRLQSEDDIIAGFLSGLKPGDLWVDAGAGEAEVQRSVMRRSKRLGLPYLNMAAFAFKMPGVVAPLLIRWDAYFSSRFQYVETGYFERFARSAAMKRWRATTALITDLYGVMSYTSDPQGVLLGYARMLKTGGRAVISLEHTRRPDEVLDGGSRRSLADVLRSAEDVEALTGGLLTVVADEVKSMHDASNPSASHTVSVVTLARTGRPFRWDGYSRGLVARTLDAERNGMPGRSFVLVRP